MDINLLKKTVKESKTINETLTKMGKNTSSGNYKLFNRYVKKYDIDISHFLTRQEIVNELYKNLRLKKNENENIFKENSLSSRSTTKKRIIKEKLIDYKCFFCGNDGNWLGKNISLILDHINGVNNDNRIENLRFVCPNCNSTLDTHCKGFKGIELNEKKKNKIDKRKIYIPKYNIRKVVRPNVDILLNDVKNLGYRKTGEKYGVSDNSIRNWIKWASNRP